MTQNNTPTTFPPHLINGFKKLADDFEAHIRADERSRIAKRFADSFCLRIREKVLDDYSACLAYDAYYVVDYYLNSYQLLESKQLS